MAKFSAETLAVGHIYRVLRALGSVAELASVTLSDEGVKVSVEDPSHACQAHLFLVTSLFSTYSFSEEDVYQFSLSLASLISCLQMYSDADASCRMIYDAPGSPFVVLLREGNMTTRCELQTLQKDLAETIALETDQLEQKVIIKGQVMLDTIRELETVGTEQMTTRASYTEPHFVIISTSAMGRTQMMYPNERAVLETFFVEENATVTNSYLFSLVAKAKDAITLATRVSLRCDSNGVMSLQTMCEFGTGKQSFIDFRFLSLDV